MNKDFKGVWIPKKIWLAKDLSIAEKFLLVEIIRTSVDDRCIESNRYFADYMNKSIESVKTYVRNLVHKGYIEKLPSRTSTHRMLVATHRCKE